MNSDPIRAALERLVNAYKECSVGYEEIWPQYLDGPMAAALAALAAAPEGEVNPPVELVEEWLREARDQPPGPDVRVIAERAAQWGAAQSLRRPATPPAPPEGEVGELVAWLRERVHECLQIPWTPGIKHFGRAATLLEQLSAAAPAVVPVAVSERLPGEGDCDAEGRCWWGDAGWAGFVPSWRLCEQPSATWFTHWLPAHALPIPAPQGGEGSNG